MHERFRLLSIIEQIVKADPNPTSFPCNTRDIILRYQGDWPQAMLDELEREGFIEIRKLDRVTIFITKHGLERAAQFSEKTY